MRNLALAVCALGLAAPLLADQAAAFFDDSAVREIRLYFDDPNWYNVLYRSHASDPNDPYFPARFQSGNIAIPKIGVRFKGHSSFQRNGVKKPFKLDFNEYDDKATFYGLKKLNLHNGDLQPDFLHEKLFLEFAGKYVCAMRAVHVRLYVNDNYYGLYLAVEQPDKTMMQRCFGSDEDGNLYEAGENVAANMSYLGADPAAYKTRYELKTNEPANDYSGLIKMLDVLNNTPAAELPAKIEPLMDVENVLYGMALNNLFTNLESYLGSAAEYYLYQRSRDNKFVHIHWDTNETFGSTGDGTPRIANPFTLDPFYLPAATAGGPGGGPGGAPGFPGVPGQGAASNARPLLEKLWAVPEYKRLYLQMLAKFLREGFDEKTIAARARELADRIREDYAADRNKAYTMAQFETALTNQVTANGFTTYGLSQFARERSAYLRPLLNSMAQASDVRINEIASGPGSAAWVELYNLGPGPVSTNGFYLTDDPATPAKWALPARTLADGEFLVLWLDGDTSQGETHASFRLAAAGGTLYLYATAVGLQNPIDTVRYPALSAGQSYARMGLYGSQWKLSSAPTQGAANAETSASTAKVSAGTGRLLINEFMADNDSAVMDPDEPGAYEDWFEVYNPGSSAVDMSGMYITDNPNNPTKWKVPDGVVIPARGYLVFWADGETAQGKLHTSWSLSADGESISIYDTDGKTLIDTVTFGPQQTDVAFGRTTDGAATWSLFSPPTPGAANASPLANRVLNAAGYQTAPVAPESIASAFVAGLASATTSAVSTPLPLTLGGVTVTITDSAGAARPAPLYFVSPSQVNFQIPAGTAKGKAKLSIRKQDGATIAGDILIRPVAPGLFSADATGTGVGLLAAIRADAQGNQTALAAYRYEISTQKFAAVPISLGSESDKVFLVLYGTGIRNVGAISKVTASVGGISVPVTFAAAQPEFAGLDQVNIGPLPRTLAGKGEVPVFITVDGNRSNTVTVAIQ